MFDLDNVVSSSPLAVNQAGQTGSSPERPLHADIAAACSLETHAKLSKVIRPPLIDDAKRGLADIAAGNTFEADGTIGQLQQRRTAAAKATSPANPGKPGKPGTPTTKKRG